MYKSIFTVALLLMTGLFTLTSCDNKNNTPEPSQGTVKEYTQSRTTDVNGEWVYFSFATGKEVEGVTEANYKERLDWDLAFNTFFIRTNSGQSGKGKGGAHMTFKTNLAAVTEAPKDDYLTDDTYQLLGYGRGIIRKRSTANVELSGISDIKTEPKIEIKLGKAVSFYGAPPTYVYKASDNIFVIRTADGKYAKVKFISYKNAEGKPGYITFQYVYQPDGSTNLGK